MTEKTMYASPSDLKRALIEAHTISERALQAVHDARENQAAAERAHVRADAALGESYALLRAVAHTIGISASDEDVGVALDLLGWNHPPKHTASDRYDHVKAALTAAGMLVTA